MKEFCIEIICNGGTPYILGTYKDFRSCYNSLEILVNNERERRKPYFVDLEYFNNDYKSYIGGKYFRILERNVTNWEKYTQDFSKNKYSKKVVKIY